MFCLCWQDISPSNGYQWHALYNQPPNPCTVKCHYNTILYIILYTTRQWQLQSINGNWQKTTQASYRMSIVKILKKTDFVMTDWGRATHMCISKLTIIGSNNGLVPDWCQAIIWNNAGILLICPIGTNFSEILTIIHISSFKKMHLKMSPAKCQPFFLGLNVLAHWGRDKMAAI